jgi:hypothetical protein
MPRARGPFKVRRHPTLSGAHCFHRAGEFVADVRLRSCAGFEKFIAQGYGEGHNSAKLDSPRAFCRCGRTSGRHEWSPVANNRGR